MLSGIPLFLKYILTAILGATPIIELRYSVVISQYLFDLPVLPAFICGLIGNILPVYFIVKYIRPLFDFLVDGNFSKKLLIGHLRKQLKKLLKVQSYKISQL